MTSPDGGRGVVRSLAAPRAELGIAVQAPREHAVAAPRIWAVGGGKGGVGKSVVSANLAAAMAGAGRRCALIDADLGAANLHTLIGVSRPRHSLSQLLNGDVEKLADVMVQTSVPDLWLVSGNQALLEMANPTYGQKEMLLRQIRSLDVDEIVLDLGAGSAFTVLDFFLLARRGLVVVTPEPTSSENAEHFIRAAYYRSLREVARRPDVAAAIRQLRENGRAQRVRSAGELIARVRAIDPPAAKPLEERAQAFSALLLVNQVQNPAQRSIGPQLAEACRERLGTAIECVGSVDADPNVAVSVTRRQPAFQAFPHCAFSRQIEALALRLLREDADGPHERAPEPLRRVDSRGSLRAARPVAQIHLRPRAESEAVRALPPLDPAEPGSYLRRCREALGLSLTEMTERTRIRILEQIESERFEQLPPEPYLKGYLFEYARELGLSNIADLAKCYLAKCPPLAAPSANQAATQPAPRRMLGWRR